MPHFLELEYHTIDFEYKPCSCLRHPCKCPIKDEQPPSKSQSKGGTCSQCMLAAGGHRGFTQQHLE